MFFLRGSGTDKKMRLFKIDLWYLWLEFGLVGGWAEKVGKSDAVFPLPHSCRYAKKEWAVYCGFRQRPGGQDFSKNLLRSDSTLL